MKITDTLNPIRIRCYREQAGLSQRQVAERLLGGSRGNKESLVRMIQRWERTGHVSPKYVSKLPTILGTAPASLRTIRKGSPEGWWIKESIGGHALPSLVAHGTKALLETLVATVANWRIGSADSSDGVEYQRKGQWHQITAAGGQGRKIAFQNMDGHLVQRSEEASLLKKIRSLLFAWSPRVTFLGVQIPPASRRSSSLLIDVRSGDDQYPLRLIVVESLKQLSHFLEEWVVVATATDEATILLECPGYSGDDPIMHYAGLSIWTGSKTLAGTSEVAALRRVFVDADGSFVTCPWPVPEREALLEWIREQDWRKRRRSSISPEAPWPSADWSGISEHFERTACR